MDFRNSTVTGDRPRILLVEPNRSAMGVMARRLVDHGYRVLTADCGPRAIAELYLRPVDLVLAELSMPQMSGPELALAIRGEVQWEDIPIILICGRSERKGAVRGYEAGADDVVIKPFHFEMLFARIDRRIEGARVIRRLREDNAVLDARITERAIQLGELRDELSQVRITARR